MKNKYLLITREVRHKFSIQEFNSVIVQYRCIKEKLALSDGVGHVMKPNYLLNYTEVIGSIGSAALKK